MPKITLVILAIALAALTIWLIQIMPDQAWAVREADGVWIKTGEGWEVLWRGWPLLLLGFVVGGGIALVVLGRLLRNLMDADLQQEIQRLQSKLADAKAEADAANAAKDAAKAEADAEAAAALANDRAAVERLRIEALRARDAAHEIQIRARREVEAAQALTLKASSAQKESALHAKNAIMTLRRKTGDLPANYRARRAKSEP